MPKDKTALKKGFTTGASVSAAASAAFLSLRGENIINKIKIFLPNANSLEIPINSIQKTKQSSIVSIIKDAGDDPDATDKIKIIVEVFYGKKSDLEEKDYFEKCKNAYLIIKGNSGIGLVTRPGLDATVGKWAINIIPRQILVENFKRLGFGLKKEYLIIKIDAIEGEKIALKTLNPMLGVLGGISILGTTGIVEPYSNASYIRTIEIRIRCAFEEGFKEIAFSTGNRTKNAILRDCINIKEENSIRIGDFIADSLREASRSKIKVVNIACMPGKLYKYANAYEYTHAHTVKLELNLMLKELKKLEIEESILKEVKKCKSISEACLLLDKNTYIKILNKFADIALVHLKNWGIGVIINLFVYNSKGELILKRISTL